MRASRTSRAVITRQRVSQQCANGMAAQHARGNARSFLHFFAAPLLIKARRSFIHPPETTHGRTAHRKVAGAAPCDPSLRSMWWCGNGNGTPLLPHHHHVLLICRYVRQVVEHGDGSIRSIAMVQARSSARFRLFFSGRRSCVFLFAVFAAARFRVMRW